MTTINELGISKFTNIGGVTCYMNSILAILQQTPIFTDFMLCGIFKPELLTKYDKTTLDSSVTYNLYHLLKISASHDNFNIIPSSFRKSMALKDSIWGEQNQQDSQEFLTAIFGQLDNEISKKVIFIPGLKETNLKELPVKQNIITILATIAWQKFIKNEFSLVKTLFTGMTRMTTTCTKCSNQSNNFDIFQTLQLSIPVDKHLYKTFTLEDCMDHYIMNEKLDKDNMMNCSFCYKMNPSTKKTILWNTPTILIIHLKRFIVNMHGIPTQKLNNMIKYKHHIDIKKYVDSMSPDYIKGNTQYTLFAVNCHHNLSNSMINSINFGHYTSIVKNQYNKKWYHFDDDLVTKINNMDNIITQNAYMLFYQLSSTI